MAEEKLNLQSGDNTPPKLRLSEIGTLGLNVIDGEVREQIRKELQWPRVIRVYKQMLNDPMINAGINLVEMMISKVDWHVEAPENPTEEQLAKTQFIRQCMNDMEHSWSDFIKDVLSYLTYGFAVHEKVYRRRTKKAGSKYNDNLIGWKKLGPRSQDTISQWKWSKDGRNLIGVYQDLSMVNNDGRFDFYFNSPDKEPKGIFIPRDKFLLIRYNGKRDNPIGNSPLNACYIPYKFKTTIEEHEAVGIQRDLGGLPVLGLHPKYMSPDATPEDKQVYEYYKNVIRNIQNNEQAGLIYPLMYNEQGKKIVEFDLMSSAGSKSYDTDKIIKRYEDKILTALFADILKLGQDSHGSFSLAGAKTNIVAMNIEARLREIADVINNDLIPQTFALNGWDDTEFPKIVYEDLDEEDLDVFSKLVQRIGAVNFLPRNQDTVSQILKRTGFKNWKDIYKLSDEEFAKMFTDNETGAGEGLVEGMPNGTGKSNKNNSETNSDNAA